MSGKKLLSVIICLALALSLFAACNKIPEGVEIPNTTTTQTNSESISKNYETVYDDILDSCYNALIYGNEDTEELYLQAMNVIYNEYDDSLSKVGYSIKDITGDGIPELLIGDNNFENNELKQIAYACFSIKDDKPIKLFDGYYRSSYMYCGNSDFCYYGSGGASYIMFGTYTLAEDGSSLKCNDYYFSDEKYENDELIGIQFYHNTTGEWDTDASEAVDLTVDDSQKIINEMESKVQKFEVTGFNEYIPSYSGLRYFDAKFASENDDEGTDYGTKTEYSTRIILTSKSSLSELKLSKISMVDKENGDVDFDFTETLFNQDSLAQGDSLVFEIEFPGDIPNYGISFKDKDGSKKCFSIEISGKDGSLILSEI